MEGPILIAGAGSIGSVIGAKLRAAGYPVTLLGRRRHLEAIAARGLELSGLFGDHLGLQAARGFTLADDPARLDVPFPLILFTVKSYDTAAMARALAGRLAADGVIVSMQNGLGNLETLAEHFGPNRVLGARVIFGAELPRPGAAHVTVFAEPVAIGPAPGGEAATGLERHAKQIADAKQISDLISAAGIPSHWCADIMPTLWTKVLYNAALNPLGALLRIHYGALAADPDLRRIMDQVIEEAFAVARRLGVALPFADTGEYRALFYGKLVPSTYDHRPSMLADLERRGRTEIGALNGKIAELAESMGLAADINRTLTGLIRASERQRRNDDKCDEKEEI
jgi:2-dehydropantoate 2-reductase